MNNGPRRPSSRLLQRLTCAVGVAFAALWSASAQQNTDLQQQLQQLKQQYEQTTHDLEQRIAALEQQIEKEKEAGEKAKEGTISAAELAAEQAAKKADPRRFRSGWGEAPRATALRALV